MTEITYYKSGKRKPVRVSGRAAVAAPARRYEARPAARRRGLRLALALFLLLAAAVVLAVLTGRQTLSDVFAVVSLSSHIRRLPRWLLYAVPLAVCVLVALGTYCLACGRRLVFKALLLVILVAVFAGPGIALGWASALVGHMGWGGTAEQRKTVAQARAVLQHPLPNKPVNILLLGVDENQNSDSQILVRLDPQAKTISMLSLPRDLRTDIPGLGYAKLNAAYHFGGVKLAVQTFSKITGLPINHFIRVDFGGFWHIIDLLGGVYLPIDHRYYNPEGTGYQPIHLQPGYQLLHAKGSLDFVRFRHDQDGDFTRMVRQQMFLREVQRQAERWSTSWTQVLSHGARDHQADDDRPRLAPRAAADRRHGPLAQHRAHLPGARRGQHADDRRRRLRRAFAEPDRDGRAGVRAPADAAGAAPAAPTTARPDGERLRYAGGRSPASSHGRPSTVYDWSAWRALARQTSLTLEAPTIWPAGLGYDTAGVPFRAYSVKTPDKQQCRRRSRSARSSAAAGERPSTGACRPLPGRTRPPSPIPARRAPSRAARICCSTRTPTCTWSPGTRTATPTG